MNYKNFIKAFALTLCVTAFSCESDDLGKNNSISASPENVDTTIALTPDFLFVGEGDSFNYSVTLPQSFSVNSSITSQIVVDNNPVRNSSSAIALDAGSTSGTGTMEVPGQDGLSIANYNGSKGLLKVTAINANDGASNVYLPVSNTVEVNVFDRVPANSAAQMNVLLDWEDIATVNDLDLRIVNNPITALIPTGNGTTGSRYEEGFLENTVPDGDYIIAAQIFDTTNATTTAPINFRVMLAFPDGSKQLVEGTIPAGATTTPGGQVTIASLNTLVEITKSGSTYTVN